MTSHELMRVSTRAAADLILMCGSGVSEPAMRVRMERIAEDLLLAANPEFGNIKEDV